MLNHVIKVLACRRIRKIGHEDRIGKIDVEERIMKVKNDPRSIVV